MQALQEEKGDDKKSYESMFIKKNLNHENNQVPLLDRRSRRGI
jgi:hypothetical protein